MFSEKDLQQIAQRGSLLKTVEQQIDHFKSGFPFLYVIKAATIGEGIIRLGQDELQAYIHSYETQVSEKKVVKFVPASGAASRMFKALFACMNNYQAGEDLKEAYPQAAIFFDKLRDFAFFQDLKAAYASNGEIDGELDSSQFVGILRALLSEEGLNYGSLPKGLLKFHRYGQDARTAVEEHLVEGANYSKDGAAKVRLHLTVSGHHKEKFKQHIGELREVYESSLGVQYEISYSEQKPSTDIIAVEMDNQPFRNADGSLLFRPGGHGALLENLNDIEGDIIFIKNIDNVVPDKFKEETYRYKKALAGVLLAVQTKVFDYLAQLDAGIADLDEIAQFVEQELCVKRPDELSEKSIAEQIAYLRIKLNRPIRVCGMVKNEGEAGGGPFWAKNPDGTVSLQVVESAQIDKDNAEQLSILQHATHFNPVDLICALRNYQGEKFDLMNFRDPQTGFISYKSKDGRELKAQELPGLWNGSMSDWTTLFVEVPIITFNPVKQVNDLLRVEHQG